MREYEFGIIAEYKDVDTLIAAAEKVRDAGYRHWDAHTPFPVHGLDDAMGVRPTILPWLVLGAGLTGMTGALVMQWWMNAVDYPFVIGGKPTWSLAANIPVIFESTILLSALTAFFGVLALNGLPKLYNPLFRHENFKRATDDRFFIVIEAKDPAFDAGKTRALLASTGAESVEVCHDSDETAGVPRWAKAALVILIFVSWLPLALAFRARAATSESPSFHLVDDMDFQPRYGPQAASAFFADGRAMRPPIAGTLDWEADAEVGPVMLTGKTGPGEEDWATEIPVEVDEALLERGRNRYDVFCSACHGIGGAGDGMIARRAVEKKQFGFVKPQDLHEDVAKDRPVGHIFNTITHGIRTMKPYGGQISPRDRWAIVSYVRALQASRDRSVLR